jgi:hypothetical protein
MITSLESAIEIGLVVLSVGARNGNGDHDGAEQGGDRYASFWDALHRGSLL